jgi:hypothetical protein
MAVHRESKNTGWDTEITVLRVGLCKADRVLNERLFQPGQTVTIGTHWINSFMLDDEGNDSFCSTVPLFENINDQYHLIFNDSMDVKVKGKQGLLDLNVGTIANQLTKRKEHWYLALETDFKGVVTLGEYRFIFQFVRVPASVVRKPTDYKTSFVTDDDVTFLGFLSIFMMLATTFLLWAVNQPRPELLKQEEREKILAEYIPLPLDLKIEEDEEVIKQDVQSQPTKIVKKQKELNKNKQRKNAVTKVDTPQTPPSKGGSEKPSLDNSNGSVDPENTPLLTLLRTRGESSLQSNFSVDEDMDEILDDLSSLKDDVDIADNIVVRKQTDQSAKNSAKKRVDVQKSNGPIGESKSKEGPKVKAPKTQTKIQKIRTATGKCGSGINSTTRRYLAQIKQCHVNSLNKNPKTAGRIVIDLDIESGRVSSARASSNTTRDSALATCVERKIKRWKFPKECTDLASLPFVFSPKK